MAEPCDELQRLKNVTIYTDGGCEPNPGPGGYGVILIYGDREKELSGGFNLTTNNRMEILAAIVGLDALKVPCKITLYSDSKYLVDAMNLGWVTRWKVNGWLLSNKERTVNIDLWEMLLSLCAKHEVEFVWVKGHAGHRWNERCDILSKMARKQSNLPNDEGYEPRRKKEKQLKITFEGQPCRKCSTPVIKKVPRRNPNTDQSYYFEYYYMCPKCLTMYMVEEAKLRNTLQPAMPKRLIPPP